MFNRFYSAILAAGLDVVKGHQGRYFHLGTILTYEIEHPTIKKIRVHYQPGRHGITIETVNKTISGRENDFNLSGMLSKII